MFCKIQVKLKYVVQSQKLTDSIRENRQINQWNRIDLHKYSQLIFYKGADVIQWRNIDFQQMDSHMQKKNLDINLTLFTKINSKQITELNIKCKIIKLLEDNTGENLDDLELGNDFSDIPLKAQSMTESIDKLDSLK